MEQKLVAESLYVVPMGDSKQEYDMVYRMLLEAVTKDGDERDRALESAIILLIDMRGDGLLDHLSGKLKWTKAQKARGEMAYSIFTRSAESYLLSLLVPKDPVPDVVRYLNLSMAITFLWGMPDSLLAAVHSALQVSRISVKPLMLPRPPPRASDLA